MVDLTRFAFPQGRFPQNSGQGTSLLDVLGAFGASRERAEQQQLQRQQLERELEKQGELDDLVGLFTERPVGGRIGPVEGGRQVSEFPFDLSDEDKQSVLGQIMAINPDMGKNLLELRKTVEDLRLRGDENERKNVESQIKQAKAVTGLGGSIARSALQEDTLEGRQRVLRDAGRFMDAHGFPADKFFEMANEQDPDKLTSQLKQLETMSVNTEQALEDERFKLEQFQKEMQAQEKNANRAEAAFSILDTFSQEEIAQNNQLQFIQNLKNRLPTDRPPEGTDLARLGALIPEGTLEAIQELGTQEEFISVFDPETGVLVGQQSTKTGKVVPDPRTPEGFSGKFKQFQDAKQAGEIRQDMTFEEFLGLGRAQTTVNISPEKELNKQFAKLRGGFFERSLKKSEEGVRSIRTIQQARGLLNSKAGIFSGTGAELVAGFNNFLKNRVGFNLFGDTTANTQAFAGTMAGLASTILNRFGSGTGISDKDVEFAQDIVGADVSMDEDAIRTLMKINEISSLVEIASHNIQAQEMNEHLDPGVQVPIVPTPPGTDKKMEKVMEVLRGAKAEGKDIGFDVGFGGQSGEINRDAGNRGLNKLGIK